MRNLILEMSRQDQKNLLSPWFSTKLDAFIADETYLTSHQLQDLINRTVDKLSRYRDETGVETAVLGVSGGVDSALTAALLKRAGWRVQGIVMPIHQDLDETTRGIEVCSSLDIAPMVIDLSDQYNEMVATLKNFDPAIVHNSAKVRRGNIRARLRMITLYNLAAASQGLVASTDNLSELAAGFWTLHGDVGDLSPIQAMTKSWEVPMMARLIGVPESVWRANPTDGLGIDSGDESQFGHSYLELDLVLLEVMQIIDNGLIYDELSEDDKWNADGIAEFIGVRTDENASQVYDLIMTRIKNTWFKRMNPVNIKHFFTPSRYNQLAAIDELFQPNVVKE